MSPARDRAAVLALLRLTQPPAPGIAAQIETAETAEQLLAQTLGDAQTTLFGPDRSDPEELIAHAADELERWEAEGIDAVTVRDPGYPANLREVHDRPPVLFVAGRLDPADERSVAVIGSRRASGIGLAAAADFAGDLAGAGFVVISGLAAGVDTMAHHAALAAGGRTIAVIGTGLHHSYPPQNAGLQARLTREHAVVSQFWPEAPPHRGAFPARNATMSGLSRATVVIEAGERSGARVQVRHALAHGRPVFLHERLVEQSWARELAERPNVRVVSGAGEITAVLQRQDAGDALEG